MRKLIMVIGGAATGKSTFIKNHYENIEGISLALDQQIELLELKKEHMTYEILIR